MKFRTITDLTVRTGPGIKYSKIKTLPQGAVVDEMSVEGWCFIGEGWVSRGFLVAVADPPPPVPGQITGAMLLAAAEAMIEKQDYVLGADSPLKQGDNYTGETDCAEFITERVQEVTGKIYGALRPGSSNPEPYTGAWLEDMQSGKVIGIPFEQAARTPGAIVLRYDNKVKHIAFSDGYGRTVEAKGAKYGVVKDIIWGRGFKYGILLRDVVYEEVTE